MRALIRRIAKTLIFVGLVYLLPLIGAADDIFTWQVLVLAAAMSTMLLSQPDLSVDETKHNSRSDGYSVLLILIAGASGQVISVIEWGYFIRPAAGGGTAVWTVVGLALIVLGLSLRIWSIRFLGKQFTATVQIVDEHRLITSGPYGIVRHPSYLGAFLALLGMSIFLSAPIGATVTALAMGYAYRQRLASEEAALVDHFGEAYRDYQHRTKMIIPYVW